MTVPDYISPIIGYRVWRWDTTGLKSVCGEPWHPGQPLAAGCRVFVGLVENGQDAHDAPQENCSCRVLAAAAILVYFCADFPIAKTVR